MLNYSHNFVHLRALVPWWREVPATKTPRHKVY